MKYFIKPLCIILIYFLSSCAEKSTSTNSEFNSNFDINKVINLNADSFTTTEFLIPLETTKESILGEISQMYFSDSTIFIFDYSSQKLLCFDKNNGKFLKQIWKQGRGPNEFTFISSVFYSIKEKLLYVYDGGKKKMFIFSDLGDYLEEIEVDSNYLFTSFCKLNDTFWAYSPYEIEDNKIQYNLYEFTDDLKNIKSQHIPTKNFFDRKSNFYSFQVVNDKAYFITTKDAQIYEIYNNTVKPYYCIENLLVKADIEKLNSISNKTEYENNLYMNKSNYNITSSNFVYTENKIYFTIGLITKKPTPNYGHIFDFNNEISIFYNSLSHSHIRLGFKPIAYLDEYLIFLFNPSSMSEDQLLQINSVYNINISFESNPCLVFTKEY